ncbi:hypothetical protein [Halovenus sp. HT40]|uniref:hypothetical protein n=1 Tax=Halovenus sp. HT40 TaxID=3126691 RepID=UPI00300F51B1
MGDTHNDADTDSNSDHADTNAPHTDRSQTTSSPPRSPVLTRRTILGIAGGAATATLAASFLTSRTNNTSTAASADDEPTNTTQARTDDPNTDTDTDDDADRGPDVQRGEPMLYRPTDDDDHNFPFFLYAPADEDIAADTGPDNKPLLVEPVNQGSGDDNLEVHVDVGRRMVTRGRQRTLADELGCALLVPVFPNPTSGKWDNKFVQSLDTNTMHIDDGKFERVDLQLISMLDTARTILDDTADITTPRDAMFNGFSASGDFVDNFTILHPDRVASVTAGAINGMVTLPVTEYRGEQLNYQIGVNDVASLTGSEFNRSDWVDTPKLCYMGALEQSPNDDTLPYPDVWDRDEAAKARRIYGDDMQEERMVISEMIHDRVGSNSQIRVYDGIGHNYSSDIIEDVLLFHARHNDISVNKASVSETAARYTTPSDTSPQSRLIDEFDDGTNLQARCNDETTTTGAEIGFTEPVLVGSDHVTINRTVSQSFGDGRTRLMPETGGGAWGVDLGWPQAGANGTATHRINSRVLSLGETVEAQLYPADWASLDDVEATACTVVSGIAFADVSGPDRGADAVTVRAVVPDTPPTPTTATTTPASGTTDTAAYRLVVSVNGTRVRTDDHIDDVDPLTVETLTVELEDRELTSGDTVTVMFAADVPTGGVSSEDVQRVELTSISSTIAPGDADVTVTECETGAELTVSASVPSSYDPGRFAQVRAYAPSAVSSWGEMVTTLQPGETREVRVALSDLNSLPDGVSPGDVTLALVEWDDPYRIQPLATDSL